MLFNATFFKKHLLLWLTLLRCIFMISACRNVNENRAIDLSSAKLEVVESDDEMQTAAGALSALNNGYQRFVNGQFRHIHIKRVKTDEVLNLSSPPIAIISCNDLKIPAEILFDTDKNDLLLLKSAAGNITPAILEKLQASAGSLKMILVLGHTYCSAWPSLNNRNQPLADSLVTKRLETTIKNLLAASPATDSSLAKSQLLIKSAVYNDSTHKLVFQNQP